MVPKTISNNFTPSFTFCFPLQRVRDHFNYSTSNIHFRKFSLIKCKCIITTTTTTTTTTTNSDPPPNPETKKKTKIKHNQQVFNSLAVAACYGCGAPLQTHELDAPGYVHPDTYALKKKHHQLRTILCGRCRLLSHGHMITAVGGHGGYAGGKQFITAEQLRDKLSHLRHEKALIVKLVDIVDFNGSFLSRIRDLAGANPIILVMTKVDLLPKGTDLNCIGDWVVEATTKKKLK